MPLQFPSRALARLYSTAAPQSSREFDVLVLGAGVAGLSAFQQLRASLGAKPRVAVLEARNRPLGRLVSAKLPGSSSAAVDLGAQWLYADPLRKASLEGWLGEAGVEWDEWHPVERIVKTEVALPGSQPLEKLRVNLASRQPGAANIIFKSGLENTFSALAEGVNLHTGVEVKSVRLEGEKRGGRVKVDTNSGVYSADFVVCALPLRGFQSSIILSPFLLIFAVVSLRCHSLGRLGSLTSDPPFPRASRATTYPRDAATTQPRENHPHTPRSCPRRIL